MKACSAQAARGPASYSGRAFVLPVIPRLERETNVLTQGLLAASLPATLAGR